MASISVPLEEAPAARLDAVRLLQVFVLMLMLIPADDVVKAVGADGYPAALISYILMLLWLAGTIFGFHNPLAYRYPVRITVAFFWMVSMASYLFMDHGMLSGVQLASADRWLMQLAGVSGVVFVAAECLRSVDDVIRVLRVLIWGSAVCGVIALLQFKGGIDLTQYIKIPGISVNAALATNTGIGSRGGLSRVPGTATDPIELGVVAGMLMPLAIYLVMHDHARPKWRRYVACICTAFNGPASVSRSGVIAVLIACTVYLVSLPAVGRLKGFAIIPPAIGVIFVFAHGLIGTLLSYFLAGSSDPSVTHRTNNYPYVEQLVREYPWLGQGGGTYIPHSAVNILDNEYLTTAIQLGVLGVIALIFVLLWPPIAALAARTRTADPKLRDLCAALAGAGFAATVCSATFDSLSFPMFVNVQALCAGLSGTVWLLASGGDGGSIVRNGGYF
jgi:O-antigen ligase